MGAILLSIFCLISPILLHSQELEFRNTKGAIPWYDNYFTVEGLDCESIDITSEMGKVTRWKDCIYFFIPDSIGYASLKVFEGSKHILEKEIIVKSWPLPRAQLANAEKGSVTNARLRAERGVWVPIIIGNMSGIHPIVSCEISLVTNSELVYHISIPDGKFTEELRREIKKLKPNSRILCNNIKTIMPGERYPRMLNTIDLRIRD